MIDLLSHIPEPKRELLTQLVEQLSHVNGIVAVALGGSYASHTQHAASDLDVGLYYYETQPFEIDAVRHIAESVSAPGTPTVTGFYVWGAWVNGGAWIHTPHGKIDFLYRNLDQIQRTFEDLQQGLMQHDYDQQPTHGFYSNIYMAETQICIPLYDPHKLLDDLKRQVAVYPPKLKDKVVLGTLWAAEFTLLHARGFAAQGDVYNTVGCLTRTTANLTQALFALNERYFIRDKQVMETIAAFPLLPANYPAEIRRILACPGNTVEALTKSVRDMEQAWNSVVALTDGLYQSKFNL